MDALPGYVAALRKGTQEGATNGRQWLIKEGMTAVPVPPRIAPPCRRRRSKSSTNGKSASIQKASQIYEKVKAMVDEYNAKKK